VRNWYRWLWAKALVRWDRKYTPKVAERKRALFGQLKGEVLEIGAGTGTNLPFLPREIHFVAVDPNPFVEPYVREAAREQGIRVDFRQGTAEQIPAADESVDAVISTLVLCCVKDPAVVLKEVLRVLKPSGRFCFIEHVAAPPGTSTRHRQDFVCPVWKRVADGCHTNRNTWEWIESAGFESVHYDRFTVDLPIAGPHIAGFAIKAAVG